MILLSFEQVEDCDEVREWYNFCPRVVYLLQ